MVALRAALSVVATLVLATGCARTAPRNVGPASDPEGVNERMIDVYAAAIRAFAETEKWLDPVLIDDRICPEAGKPMSEGANCIRRFTEAEKTALLVELADLPHVEFVSDAQAVTRRIYKGEIDGAGLIAVGPIIGSGRRVQVSGQAYCGRLCGHWMTLVIERTATEWTVRGTTGPVAIS
jgi:hypothetical protein